MVDLTIFDTLSYQQPLAGRNICRTIGQRKSVNQKPKSLWTLIPESLDMRRSRLCLKFAKNCLKNEKMRKMFPLASKQHNMNTRLKEKFKVNKAKTERYRKSSIPYMQNLLNQEEKKIQKILA